MKLINALLYFILVLLFINSAVAQTTSLSLKEAVRIASENNPELKASNQEIDKAHQQKRIARSLLLPAVSLNASASHYFQLQPFFGIGGITPENKISYGRFGGADQLGSSLLAVQPLFNPQAAPAFQRAQLMDQESRIVLTGRQVTTMAQVKKTYLRLLVLQQRIRLQQESTGRNEKVLKDARVLYAQGKGLRVDTLRAYTAVKNLEPDLLRLSYALETGKLQLKALLGAEDIKEIVLTDSLTLPDPEGIPQEADVYNAARQNRADLQLLHLQEEQSVQQIRQARAARLPVLNAVGQYQIQSQTNRFDYRNAYYPTSSYVGLQLSVPLFTGFSNEARGRQAVIGREQSVLRLKDAEQHLRATVHQAVSDAHESVVRLKTTITVQETARLSYDIIQYRYAKGISSRLDLTDAEFTLSTSQSNYLEAVYDYLAAQISLLEIMGRVE